MVLGDLNCGAGSAALAALQSSFLTCAAADDTPSFTGFGPGLGPPAGPAAQRIDHVLVSGFSVSPAAVLVRARLDGSGRRISDHRPVVADVTMAL